MLRGIPSILSPDLLKVLAEMGHGDKLVIGDAFFPSASTAKDKILVRGDGLKIPDLLDAILKFFPLDMSVEKPFTIIDLQDVDRGKIETPIWKEYIKAVEKYDERGESAVGYLERFSFYEACEDAYAVLATGEESLYGCVILQKGTL